ncbi:hypothetical protein [Nostoc sp. UHCC 0252]|uniref:hypothetical protein n=1 Tax=Nostoc sp. UHCC 0252 TaxID=3110241 RepID=UPI002B20EE6C|nr:hypothetical protein [Nostoc sp. UHCC 0252]MEA5603693.1 hypothetical protein [Nostoc sp. UHCC 0252]
MKDKLTIASSPVLFIITALAIFFESPFLLGIVFVGFVIDGILDKVLLNALQDSAALKDLEVYEIADELENLNSQIADLRKDVDRRFSAFGKDVADLRTISELKSNE